MPAGVAVGHVEDIQVRVRRDAGLQPAAAESTSSIPEPRWEGEGSGDPGGLQNRSEALVASRVGSTPIPSRHITPARRADI